MGLFGLHFLSIHHNVQEQTFSDKLNLTFRVRWI